MNIWTLYHRPTNHLKMWVVRRWELDQPTSEYFESDERDECEEYVRRCHPGAVWIPRMPEDDAAVAGAWV